MNDKANRILEVREKFQTEKPSLAELVASGEFSALLSQGLLLELSQFAARLKDLRVQKNLSQPMLPSELASTKRLSAGLRTV